MKWFATGLTKEQLTKEYRVLAKKWHPDLNPGNKEESETVMKEINDEYDRYFTELQYTSSGYNPEDIYKEYEKAREEREIILAFLKKDKKAGKGFFTYNKYGKICTDDSDTWAGFRGGFSLCRLTSDVIYPEGFWFWRDTKEVTDQRVSRIQANIETPSYADMYFAQMFGGFDLESTEISAGEHVGKAHTSLYETYQFIHSETYGDMWISKEHNGRKLVNYAYLKVNGRIMRCLFDIDPKFFEVKETVQGKDFGYIAFQNCTCEDFRRNFDVDYNPEFSQVANCKIINNPGDLYFITDPVVYHFAKLGIVRFYQSRVNPQMRYGTFSSHVMEYKLHEMSYEDADTIQDYLDKLHDEFENRIRGMIKKGKIKVVV